MLHSARIKIAVALVVLGSVFHAAAQGTAFTYQGRLAVSGSPANGFYDLQFTIYDAGTNGNIVGGPLANALTTVSNGLFTVQLDFGSNIFNGDPRWLQIGARTNGDVNPYVLLAPLQPVTATPYAIYAPNAGTAQTAASADSVAATNISGTVSLAQLPSGIVTNGASGVALSGTFVGDGAGMTNLNANQITSGTIPDSALSSNVLAISGFQTQTIVWSNAGVYTLNVPPGVTRLVAKLWGAGGAGSSLGGKGGGGAFVQKTISVASGQTYQIVVGQGGFIPSGGGGVGNGITQGGSGGVNAGQGGQASSFFYMTPTNYIMLAVAGAGGGSGSYNSDGGAGGNPGQTSGGSTGGYNGIGGVSRTDGAPGSPGDNYATNATTLGISSLSAAGGNGGNSGPVSPGGGGGGFGGGGGGGYGGLSDGNNGGGGGGSYGDLIIGGSGALAGNTGDSNYVALCGNGGINTVGRDGLAVILLQLPMVTLNGEMAATHFTGDGQGLTNLSVTNLTGILSSGQLPPNLVTNTEIGVALSGTFVGNGHGLTNLNASQITSGTFTGTVAGSVSGTITGNGAGLTNLNAANLSSGIASDSVLSANIPRLNANANFNASIGATNFVGNGSGLTNVPWVIKWNVVSGTSQTAVGNNGYLLTNNTAQVVVTLPAAPNVGEIVRIAGTGIAGWKLAQNAGQYILASQIGGQFGVVWNGSVNSGGWQSIACSADGTRLVGISQHQPFTSMDGGNNWIQQYASSGNSQAVATSADGTRLVAVTQPSAGYSSDGGIYTSTNSGVTWNQKYSGSFNDNWTCVCSSDDGTHLYAGNGDGYPSSVYRSIDSGFSWTTTLSLSGVNITAITCSADGTRVCAVLSGGNIWVSTDSGATWTQRDASRYWSSVASSTDGMKLVAAEVNGQIYTSSNGGTNWTARLTSQYWQAVASSGDGNRLLAAVNGGSIYVSSDAGVTWTARDVQSWTTVASSRDGTRLFGGTYDRVYRSSPTSVPTTTVGTAGYLNAPQYGTIELQYIGAGVFLPLSFSGTFEVK